MISRGLVVIRILENSAHLPSSGKDEVKPKFEVG